MSYWRVFAVDPDGGLCSPLMRPVLPDDTALSGRTWQAVCLDDPDHQPPVAGCSCGVFAATRFEDACGIVQASYVADVAARPPNRRPKLVAELRLTGPVLADETPLVGVGRATRRTFGSVRGAGATLAALWVPHRRHCGVCAASPAWCEPDRHQRERVAARYGVPLRPLLPGASPRARVPSKRKRWPRRGAK